MHDEITIQTLTHANFLIRLIAERLGDSAAFALQNPKRAKIRRQSFLERILDGNIHFARRFSLWSLWPTHLTAFAVPVSDVPVRLASQPGSLFARFAPRALRRSRDHGLRRECLELSISWLGASKGPPIVSPASYFAIDQIQAKPHVVRTRPIVRLHAGQIRLDAGGHFADRHDRHVLR
jgi:hypothetical protein